MWGLVQTSNWKSLGTGVRGAEVGTESCLRLGVGATGAEGRSAEDPAESVSF